MWAARTSGCVAACLAALAGPAGSDAAGHSAARMKVDHVSPVLRAGGRAHLRVRLAFTGERSCRLTFSRGRVTQTTAETLTERRLVTWRWRVPRNARSGRWRLEAACGAEAELTVRAARRVRVVGPHAGARVAAARVRVFTSGDPLVMAFAERP